jgi:sterol desaturase/sphingolipid hydroxylase (fatty acid hydroxylase superfamily)
MKDEMIHGAMLILGSSLVRYIVVAGIPFLLFYILLSGKANHLKIQERRATRKDFAREILHSLQSTLVFTVIGSIIILTPFRQYTRIYDHVSDYPAWYMALSVVLALLIHDTYFYWMHRILHHQKLFALTHLLHHKSTNPSPWTSYSFHIIESFTEGFVLVPIVLLMPIHPFGIALFMLSSFMINVYGHLGYEIMPRWFRHTVLFKVFNTSVYHNLHHSKFNGNYGLYLRVWDRLMKTENPDYEKEYDRLQDQRFPMKEKS